MSDSNDNPNRPPLSSSSATVGGTSALRVKVDPGASGPEKMSQSAEAAVRDALPEEHMRPAPEQPSIPDLAAEAAEAMSAHLEATQDTIEEAAPAFQPEKTAEAIEHAVTRSIEAGKKAQAQAATIFDQVSQSFTAVINDAGSDAALITFTLLEFAQANARNNYQLAQDYAGARSVPEIVNVQAAYFKRQVELMNRHSSELRKAAAEITSKKAAQIQASVARQ